jgi:hypothetical protein
MPSRLLLVGLAVTVAGCTASVAPTRATRASRPASHSPPATTAPSPSPGPEQISVVAAGVGDYDLQAIPVALLRNLSSTESARAVTTHFGVHHPGGVYQLDGPPVTLGPGQTLAVAALCTDSCEGATSVDVAVSVASWGAGGVPAFAAATGTFQCGSPCRGRGGFQGDAAGALSGDVASGALVDVFAACTTPSGAIVGGGQMQRLWPGGTQAVPVSVPVLVSVQPNSCEIYGAVA